MNNKQLESSQTSISANRQSEEENFEKKLTMASSASSSAEIEDVIFKMDLFTALQIILKNTQQVLYLYEI